MSCPTCNHTLTHADGDAYWCPECGTLVELMLNETLEVSVPKCRQGLPILGTV